MMERKDAKDFLAQKFQKKARQQTDKQHSPTIWRYKLLTFLKCGLLVSVNEGQISPQETLLPLSQLKQFCI